MKEVLSKQLFVKIKKMSFDEMSSFIQTFYLKAFQDGQAEGLTEREVQEVLLTAGVEEEKVKVIMEAFDKRMEEESNILYRCGNCDGDLTCYKEAKFCPHCGAELHRE